MAPRPKTQKMGEPKQTLLQKSPNTDIAKRVKKKPKQPTSKQTPTAYPSTDRANKSPRLSRLEEKNSLISLNNRLAAIIERNHQLELENSQLTIQIETAEEALKVTKNTIKVSIEKQNQEIKKQLLDAKNQMAEIAVNADNSKNALDDANGNLQHFQTELVNIYKQLSKLHDEICATNLELEQQRFENAQLTAHGKSLEANIKKLSDESFILKDESEMFSLRNSALQSQLKTKSLELTNELEIHQKQVTELRSFNQKQIKEVGEKIGKDYESNMQKVIKFLRAKCEQHISSNKVEQDNLFNIKKKDLLKINAKVTQALRFKTADLQQAEKTILINRNRVTYLEKETKFLAAQLKAHEENMKVEGEAALVGTTELENQLQIVINEKIHVINEYKDLMETKVALDNEIATYINLLEGEDERLNDSMEARRNSRKRHWNST